MTTQAYRELRDRQDKLLRSLVRGAGAPPGFAESAVQITARVLREKRQRGVIRTWPSVVSDLGPDFGAVFGRFAAATPFPVAGGSLADGRNFVEWHECRTKLSIMSCRRIFMVDLTHTGKNGNLTRRCRPAFVLRLCGKPAVIAIGVWSCRFGARYMFLSGLAAGR